MCKKQKLWKPWKGFNSLKRYFLDSICGTPVDFKNQAPVVQTLDNSIHWINVCPVDNAVGFCNHLSAG